MGLRDRVAGNGGRSDGDVDDEDDEADARKTAGKDGRAWRNRTEGI